MPSNSTLLRRFTVGLLIVQCALMLFSSVQILRGEQQLYNLSLILINAVFASWNVMMLRDTRRRD